MRSSPSFGMHRSPERHHGMRSRRAMQRRSWQQYKQKLLIGLRWMLLLGGLGLVNLYVFWYRKDTSLPEIQRSIQAGGTANKAPQPMASSAHTSAPATTRTMRTSNPILTLTPPSSEPAPLEYARFVETPLTQRLGVERVVGNTSLTKPQQQELLRTLRDAIATSWGRSRTASVVVYTNLNGQFVALDYHHTPTQAVQVRMRTLDGAETLFDATPLQGERKTQVELVTGKISSSRLLVEALPPQESPALAPLLVQAFAYDRELQTQCVPGDSFSVVVEKVYQGDTFLRYGRVLAARYGNNDSTVTAYYWTGADPQQGKYYTAQGKTLERKWLRSPVVLPLRPPGDISNFKPAWQQRPKKDASYALYPAAVGTRVNALGTGILQPCDDKAICTWKLTQEDGEIRYHNLQLARSLKVGQRVQAGQAVGTVQTSSTCPKGLCLSVWQGGRLTDPIRTVPPRINASIPEQPKAAFVTLVNQYNAQWNQQTSAAMATMP